jgi:hypothetical protein
MSLKIGPVPDRAPVKISLSLTPETHEALLDYAAIHAREHAQEAPIAALAVLMIERFLESDAAFKRARKSLHQSATVKA